MPNLNETPSAERTHIGFFGKMNSGKSSLVNALAGQEISIVSDVAGTTTDPVSKSMEIHGIGACLLTDTAGFDDTAPDIGKKRAALTEKAAEKTDIAVILFSDDDISEPLALCKKFIDKDIPAAAVISKCDSWDTSSAEKKLSDENISFVKTSALQHIGIDDLREKLISLAKENAAERFITGDLVSAGDVVLLVMPQDIQAPKGRLILPQVPTIRELLDRKCTVVSCTADTMENSLGTLKYPPKLIITDSQIYKNVCDKKPAESKITSFSTLFAAYKGDIKAYIEGAKAVDSLTENSHILIAECCTHAPMEEDIGRVKIPRLLRKKAGEGLSVDVAGGSDFPDDLTKYDLIIQCGACMFNRRYVMSRIDRAKKQNVPITNYGVVIAYINGILDKIETP